MKVIFTCGGTAGHVNPALALAGYMRKQDPTVEILFVGTPNGIERGLVAEAGYDYRGIEVGSFERSMDLDSLRHNAKSAVELLTLRRRAQAILREFPADLVVGTGGYASYPMVKYAALQGIPTAVHEANMIPGLTTRMLEKHASRIMVGFEECRIHYKHPERIVVTGTPVRGDFFDMSHDEAKASLGIPAEQPLVVSFWGSLGASTMNRQMLDFFEKERSDGYPFRHIHAAGDRSWTWMQPELEQRGLTVETEAPRAARLEDGRFVNILPDPQFDTNPAKVRYQPDLTGGGPGDLPGRRIYHQRDHRPGAAYYHRAVPVCGQRSPGEKRPDPGSARRRLPHP